MIEIVSISITLLVMIAGIITSHVKNTESNKRNSDDIQRLFEYNEKQSEKHEETKTTNEQIIHKIETEFAIIKLSQETIGKRFIELFEKQDKRLDKMDTVIEELKELSIKHSYCQFNGKSTDQIKSILK